MIAILKAVVHTNDPFGTAWRTYQGRRFENVAFGADVPLLPFT